MPFDPRTDPRYKNDKLFLSLINQESRFNPNAVSPTGARGYAQVLPSTARSPGFGVAPAPNAISDPEANVAFGKAYFEAMKKRYNGDNAAALVAYNGGPGAADKWVASGKNDKVISAESRNYYKKILGSAGMDFSKASVKLPTGTPTSEDDSDEETNALTGFSKLKKPGGSTVVPKADEAKDSTDDKAEESDTEEESTTPKVKATKASKKEDDEDDDEEDDDEGSSSGSKSKGGRTIAGGALELTPFTPGPLLKPVPIQLGIPKLQLAAVETLDDPRER